MSFDYHNLIGILSGIVSFSFYLFYFRSILRRETKPSRTSWWIWAFIGIMIMLSYYFSGARETIWVPIGESIGPLLIAFISIKYGEGGWSKIDRICLMGAVIGAILWFMSGSPLVGLLSFLVIDFWGVIPTLIKSYFKPHGESNLAWSLSFLGSFLNLFAIQQWSLPIIIYPIYTTLINFIIILTIRGFFSKHKNTKKFEN